MSSSIKQKKSCARSKKSVPVSMQEVPSSSREKVEIDDVALLVTVKPIFESVLKYINKVEEHSGINQNHLKKDDPQAFERLKYTLLRDEYLKIFDKGMIKYTDLYCQNVETDGDIKVSKKINSNVIGALLQTMMFMGRDIE